MAVRYKFIILIIISFLFSSGVSFAAQPSDNDIVELATKNYKKALDSYEKQLKYCENKSSKNKIDRSIFKKIKLTQLDLQIAIGRFYFNALDKCEGNKFGYYLIHRGIYRETLKKFNSKFDSDNPLYYDDIEVFGTRYHHIRFELKYLKFPKKERDKLENMVELFQVFDLQSARGF
ncbi:hypothetical protein MNBD_GAMMA22-831 [hydrothermal vent metagenome]|uniref:Uncharacterized protein n=1 Tax=hydrothermal vent metagenome TaxID=652676 RepID=A0A3B1A894_9ZZZZ